MRMTLQSVEAKKPTREFLGFILAPQPDRQDVPDATVKTVYQRGP